MNCIIIHGCPSNKEKSMDQKTRTYDKHWMPWLKEKLEEKGIKVEIPLMPAPWEPDYELWKKEFSKLTVNKNTILVGHSCGGGFLVRWIDESKIKIGKLILVSPGKVGKARNEFKSNFYGNKVIKNINKYITENIVIFTSNDDIPGHIKGAYEYEKELPAKIIFLRNHGHFCEEDMGTKEFPELLNEII
ncbi:alpha/beta hydrolase [Candidatus Pacearchaeota archaeon]|nr:alpha/beta hydrolase [Candidatus Pacearchaeota archaeon]